MNAAYFCSPMVRRVPILGAACLLAFGCDTSPVAGDPSIEDRAALLASWCSTEFGVLAAARPRQLTRRFDEMQTSPFRFLRGSEAWYVRDLRDPAQGWAASRFVDPTTAFILLQGDAHPENIRTYGHTGDQRVELNDFDASGFGPFYWEVRRAAASLLVALHETPAPLEVGEAAVRALVSSYVEVFDNRVEPKSLGPADVGVVLQARLAKAAEDGAAREELDDFTVMDGDVRRLKRGPTDPDDPREALLDVSDTVSSALPAAIAEYRSTLLSPDVPDGFFAIKDVARRCGQGVGSLTSVRLYLLVEGPTTDPADDVILQLKEAGDASIDRGLPLDEPAPDAAQRVVQRARMLQSRPDSDPWLGSSVLLGLPVVVSSVSAYGKSVRVAKDLVKAAGSPDSIVEFASDMGTVLAFAHARGSTFAGAPSGPLIAAVLQGRSAAFVDETTTFAVRYAAVVEADHGRFTALRENLGPLLGIRPRVAADRSLARSDDFLDPDCP